MDLERVTLLYFVRTFIAQNIACSHVISRQKIINLKSSACSGSNHDTFVVVFPQLSPVICILSSAPPASCHGLTRVINNVRNILRLNTHLLHSYSGGRLQSDTSIISISCIWDGFWYIGVVAIHYNTSER